MKMPEEGKICTVCKKGTLRREIKTGGGFSKGNEKNNTILKCPVCEEIKIRERIKEFSSQQQSV